MKKRSRVGKKNRTADELSVARLTPGYREQAAD
jgi:hypothetical protein